MRQKFGMGFYHPGAPPGGFPRYGYQREMPVSMPTLVRAWGCSWLPFQLRQAGYELLQMEPYARPQLDPFVLYDPYGGIVAEWERAPSFGELMSFLSEMKQ